jgi:hypothetical protein
MEVEDKITASGLDQSNDEYIDFDKNGEFKDKYAISDNGIVEPGHTRYTIFISKLFLLFVIC